MKIDLSKVVLPKREITSTENQNSSMKPVPPVRKDIAIIGMSGSFASCDTIDEYWEALKQGEDCIHEYPLQRKFESDEFLKHQDRLPKDSTYFNGGFLNQIHQFDNDFFSLSPLEAKLMSPEQRRFLEIAWEAFEDAGYNAFQMKGSKTGIFIGHSTDFGIRYKEFVDTLDPELSSFAISGNLNPIIASRISYILDLKGPSINVDTACSSALTAIHMACRSIKEGECTMALAGAVKIDLLPISYIKQREDELGITSPDCRTRTFDKNSNGTGLGEGVGAIVLKDLEQARKDGDSIYAIIKGSAINHDGTSANLTSPNPLAQESVIVDALLDAKIQPDTISFIEAHGTGTKIGDPIEIRAITNAYARFTEKKQFCAIGSVKSNLGHLDHAAGIAGIIKCILALKYKELPASIHYESPNEAIDFKSSPVYVNDKLHELKSEHGILRCGISAFGLSGTNCHIILEEPPRFDAYSRSFEQEYMLTISAKSKKVLQDYIWKFQNYFYQNSDVDLSSVCYTANKCREQYNYRLAIIFHDIKEIQEKLEALVMYELEKMPKDCYYGHFEIISKNQKIQSIHEITLEEKEQFNQEMEALIKHDLNQLESFNYEMKSKIASLFVKGANVNWELLYSRQSIVKTHIPTYPFQKKSFWIKAKEVSEQQIAQVKTMKHPLFQCMLASSYDRVIYESSFQDKDDFILKEHVVSNISQISDAVYLEMAIEAIQNYFKFEIIQLKDVNFYTPLTLDVGDVAQVQTILQVEKNALEFKIASKTQSHQQWTVHASGSIEFYSNQIRNSFDIKKMRQECTYNMLGQDTLTSDERTWHTDRWDCIECYKADKHRVLTHLKIKEAYRQEVANYHMYLALYDEAVHVGLRAVGSELYEPYSCKNFVFYQDLPNEIYSYIVFKTDSVEAKETVRFDLILMDVEGNILARANDYIIKRGNHSVIKKEMYLYQKNWFEESITKDSMEYTSPELRILLVNEEQEGKQITIDFRKICDKEIVFRKDSHEEEFDYDILQNLNQYQSCHFIDICSYSENDMVENMQQAESDCFIHINQIIQLLKVATKLAPKVELKFDVITSYTDRVLEEDRVLPFHNLLSSFVNDISNEFNYVSSRTIDIGIGTLISSVVNEISTEISENIVAYRKNRRFLLRLEEKLHDSTTLPSIPIKENGVYLITGGTGDIGIEVAEYISNKAPVNLILIGHHDFPKKEQWNQIMIDQKQLKLIQKIKKIQAIEQRRTKITFVTGDVSNETQLSRILSNITDQYTKVNGIIHAAGVAGDGFIINKNLDQIKNVILPKVRGAWVLDDLTKNMELDFFIMFSSISSLVPEAGQTDYAAANQFLDVYSKYRNQERLHSVTIQWPVWKKIGMAERYGVDLSKEAFQPISNSEAFTVFDQSLNFGTNVLIGKLNYKNYCNRLTNSCVRLSKSMIMKYVNDGFKENSSGEKIRSDITLTGNNEFSDTEKKIASVIGTVLDLTEVNVHQTFTELGGNSIIAIKVEVELEKLKIDCTLNDLQSKMTVRDIANKNDHIVSLEGQTVKNQLSIEKEPRHGEVKIDHIQPFNELIYKGCFYSAFLPIVLPYGNEHLRYFLNDVIDYKLTDKSDVRSFDAKYRVVCTFEDSIKQSQLQLKIQIVSQDIVNDLKRSIDQWNPVIISADCYYESIRKDMFQKKHSPHEILVYGYNELTKEFIILEHPNDLSPLYKEEKIGFKSLEESYTGYLEHYKGLDNVNSYVYEEIYDMQKDFPSYYEFIMPTKVTQSNTIDVHKLYQQYLRDNYEQFLHNLKVLSEFMPLLKELSHEKMKLKNMSTEIVELISRLLQYKQIEKYRLLHMSDGQEEGVQKITDIIHDWEFIRSMLLKYSITGIYVNEFVEYVPNVLDGIVAKESNLLEQYKRIAWQDFDMYEDEK